MEPSLVQSTGMGMDEGVKMAWSWASWAIFGPRQGGKEHWLEKNR